MHVSRKTHWHLRLNSLIFLALFLCAVGLAAWLSHQYRFVQDWTYAQRNSLAPATAKLLRHTKQPIHMIAFVADDAALHQRIRQQIAIYQAVDPRITLRFSNPDLYPQQAKRYGVTHAGQLAIELGGRTRVVNDLRQETLLNAFLHLTRSGKRWIVFLEGHKERSPFDTKSAGLSRFAAALQHDGFHLLGLNLLRTPQIPDNTAVLVIAQPQRALTPGEAKAVTDFVSRGGSLLWLHAPGPLHGLAGLAKQLGVSFVPGTVVDANPNLRAMIGISNPAVVPVLDYGSSPITADLQIQTLMPFSAAIVQPAGGKDWKAVPLLRTLPKSWSETAALRGEVHFDKARGDTPGPLILGETLSRQTNGKQQRVAVIGSGAFLSNAFIGQGANLNLALGTLNWLSHDDNLVQIHLPSAPDTRLLLSRPEGYAIAALFLILLPAGLFVAGMLIWMRRRRPAR
ncbi:MAG: Gldg family protein [Acidihalobacter sp.]